MQLIYGLLFSWLLAGPSWAAYPKSPCPGVFTYEGSEPVNNRWYAVISLRSDENLMGVRLDVDLDRYAELIVSSLGTLTTTDNVKFTVLKMNQSLIPGHPLQSKIMVKFNRSTGVPRVQFIRLNGQQICPTNPVFTDSEESFGSPEKTQATKRPDPDFGESSFGEDSGNEFVVSGSGNFNNNNKPPTYRPTTTTTEEPFTTKKISKTTTTSMPDWGDNGDTLNNRPNPVSLQITDLNGDINALISGYYMQSEKTNNTSVIITPIDSDQLSSQVQGNRPSISSGSRPGSGIRPGSGTRPGAASNNNSRPWKPNENNRPLPEQQATTSSQKPIINSQGASSSFSSTVDSQLLPTDVCGYVKLTVPLVTHGQETHRGQWPWHVALYAIDGINLSYRCGGSLVSKRTVITAAHCVFNRFTGDVVKSNKLLVHLGKYHQLQLDEVSGVVTKLISNIVVFPSYSASTYLGDIALLTLASAVMFSDYVVPICLWDKNSINLAQIVGEDGTVVGWGNDETMNPTAELKMAKMPIVSHQTCLNSYKEFYSERISDKTFCAGYKNGTSVCNGDSGGGMVFNRNSRWYLRGIVSMTVAKDGQQRVCDTMHYVVFTDAAKYLDFIMENLV